MVYYATRKCCGITFHNYDDYVAHRMEVHGNNGALYYRFELGG